MRHETPTSLRIQKARNSLILDHPFFGSLLFRLKGRECRSIQTMATDGVSIYYNPEFVETLSTATLAGTLAHEVMHPALHHHVRRSGRDPKRWNVACDFAINPLLVDAGLSLPDGVLIDNRFRGMSAEQIYNLLESESETEQDSGHEGEDGEPGGEESKDEPSLGGDSNEPSAPVTEGGISQVLDAPLPDEETPTIEEQAREWDVAVNQATTVARQAGRVAVSDDPAASVSGEYFYHMQSGVRSPPHATSVPRIACWIFVLAPRAWNFHPDFTVPPTTSQLHTIVSVFLCNGICFWLQTSRHPIKRRLR